MGTLLPAGLVMGTGLDMGGVAGGLFGAAAALVTTGLRLMVGAVGVVVFVTTGLRLTAGVTARPLLLVGVPLAEEISSWSRTKQNWKCCYLLMFFSNSAK